MPAELLEQPETLPRGSILPSKDPLGIASGSMHCAEHAHEWLRQHGVTTADDVWNLPGVVVCGHADRHVMRVTLGQRTFYLKREHRVGWKIKLRNARAGWGWVSRSEREAKCLSRFHELGLPVPRWIAHGTNSTGQSFILIPEVRNALDLPTYLQQYQPSLAARREILHWLARSLADCHRLGVHTPDLSAKHVLIDTETLLPTLIDWQSAVIAHSASPHARVRALAGLLASLPPHATTRWEQFKFVREYCRHLADGVSKTQRRELIHSVLGLHARLAQRNSSAVQRLQPAAHVTRTWVWVAPNEAVCIRPGLQGIWPNASGPDPYKPLIGLHHSRQVRSRVILQDGKQAWLTQYHSFCRPIFWERLTGHSWRSPAAQVARLEHHLVMNGVPCLELLGFGQRRQGSCQGQSFTLVRADDNLVTLTTLWHSATSWQRANLVTLVGAHLRRLYDLNCVVENSATYETLLLDLDSQRIVLDPSRGLRKVRRLTGVRRQANLRRVIHGLFPHLSESEWNQFHQAYTRPIRHAEILCRGEHLETTRGQCAS